MLSIEGVGQPEDDESLPSESYAKRGCVMTTTCVDRGMARVVHHRGVKCCAPPSLFSHPTPSASPPPLANARGRSKEARRVSFVPWDGWWLEEGADRGKMRVDSLISVYPEWCIDWRDKWRASGVPWILVSGISCAMRQ